MGSQIRHNAIEDQKLANLVCTDHLSKSGMWVPRSFQKQSIILEICHGHGTHTENEKLPSWEWNHAGAVDLLATVRWCQDDSFVLRLSTWGC